MNPKTMVEAMKEVWDRDKLQTAIKRADALVAKEIGTIVMVRKAEKATCFLPVKLVSEANRASSEHWRVRHRRAKQQRQLARERLHIYTVLDGPIPDPPVKVTLRRIGGHKMDPDNFPLCFKHIQDGIADFLHVNDGDRSKVEWVYEDEPGVGGVCRGCQVTVEAK
jgi:hypothetical protein